MAEVCCHFVGGVDQGRPGPHALGGAAKAAGGRQGGAFVAPVAWKAACREAELLGCWPIGTIPWNWKMCAMRTGGALGAVGMGVREHPHLAACGISLVSVVTGSVFQPYGRHVALFPGARAIGDTSQEGGGRPSADGLFLLGLDGRLSRRRDIPA